MRKLISLLACGLVAPLAAHAASAPPMKMDFSDMLTASGISARGVVDASYNYLNTDGKFIPGSTCPSEGLPAGCPTRAFADSKPNTFSLNQVGLFVGKSPAQGVGGLVNLTIGDDVAAFGGFGSDKRFDVTQAYVSYATGGLTIIGGKFVTLAGAEVIDASSNSNASRGILFGYAIPFSHTGVRTTYKINNAVSVIGGINNGWDTHLDGNDTKIGEFGFLLTPTSQFSFAAQAYVGNEPTSASTSARRYLVDIVATIAPTANLTFIVNADFAKQKEAGGPGTPDAKWSGVAAYANVKFCDTISGSLRGEYFHDNDGARTGVVQTWNEVTATANFIVAKGLSVLPEIRYDFSDEKSFASSSGPTKTQLGLMLKALYSFGNT